MTAFLRLVYWDWVHEMKRKETIVSMILFSLVTLFVFSRAIEPDSETGQKAHAGILWVTFLLAGAIGIDRAFRSGDGGNKVLEGLLLSPVGRTTIYYAKVTSTLLFLLVMEAVILVLFCVLYNVSISLSDLGALAVVILAVTIGLVAVGVTLSAMTRAIHGGDVILRILLFALLIPLLWSAVRVTASIFSEDAVDWNAIGIIGAFDLVYVASGQLLFEPILQDYDAS